MDRTLKRVFGSLVTRWRTIQRTTHTTLPTWKTICCIILEPESRGSASHHRKRRLFLNWFMITWATTTEYTYGYKWNNYTAYNPSRRSSAAWNPVRLRCMVYETANGCVMFDTNLVEHSVRRPLDSNIPMVTPYKRFLLCHEG